MKKIIALIIVVITIMVCGCGKAPTTTEITVTEFVSEKILTIPLCCRAVRNGNYAASILSDKEVDEFMDEITQLDQEIYDTQKLSDEFFILSVKLANISYTVGCLQRKNNQIDLEKYSYEIFDMSIQVRNVQNNSVGRFIWPYIIKQDDYMYWKAVDMETWYEVNVTPEDVEQYYLFICNQYDINFTTKTELEENVIEVPKQFCKELGTKNLVLRFKNENDTEYMMVDFKE